MNLELTTHGIYPRSETLIRACQDLERKRIKENKWAEILNQDQKSFFKLQQKLGCQLLESGYLNWQDRFRPFATSCQGLKAGPLTRFGQTNTFFRKFYQQEI